ncbi:MAG: hypothetical protein HUJ29_04570 [Gammaproteobacteria bacterium]|nr:hypothetical protein [Gammaproteobacteria bacterium]
MFEYYRFRKELKKLHASRVSLTRKITELEENRTDYYESQPEIDWHIQQEDKLDYGILLLQTNFFKQQLESHLIPMPSKDNSEYWFKYDFDDNNGEVYLLSESGIIFVKSLLREEERIVRDRIMFWVSIIFGLIGVVTGLVSLLVNK